MPELPEVQTTVYGINQVAKGLIIKDVWTDYKSRLYAQSDTIKNPKYFSFFKKEIVGAKILNATRRGKNILIHLSNKKTILVHMKMTGHMMYGSYRKLDKKDVEGEWWRPIGSDTPLHDPFNRFIHLVFTFTNKKQLVLSDMRRFAKVTLIDTHTAHESPHLKKHGPEPLDPKFTAQDLKEAINRKPNGAIKTVLMNHEIISGIGNIYSDEILWRVGIHPLERVKNIKKDGWTKLWKAMKETLQGGIDFGGDSMSDYRNIKGERGAFQEKHKAYQKTGTVCQKRNCMGIILRLKVGGRSAHFCSVHQKLIFS